MDKLFDLRLQFGELDVQVGGQASGRSRTACRALGVDEFERRLVRDRAVLALVTSCTLSRADASAVFRRNRVRRESMTTHVVVALGASSFDVSVRKEALVLLAVQLLVLVLLEPPILVQLQEDVLADSE